MAVVEGIRNPSAESNLPSEDEGFAYLTPEEGRAFEEKVTIPLADIVSIKALRIETQRMAKREADKLLEENSDYKKISKGFEKRQEADERDNIRRLVRDAAREEIESMKEEGLLNPDLNLTNPPKFRIKDQRVRRVLADLDYIDEDELSVDLSTALAARLLAKPIGHLIVNKFARYPADDALQEEASNYLNPRKKETVFGEKFRPTPDKE